MRSSPAGSAQETVRGAIDLTIGRTEADERYLFGRILGLALDALGRIYVSDRQIGSVRGYGSAGEFLFQLGRTGDGPLEYKRYPSSTAILPDGHLWIVSFEDKVLRADPAQNDVSAGLEVVPVGSSRSWLYDGLLALDAERMLIATGGEPDRRDGLRRRRVSLRDGRTVSKTNPWALQPTPEEMGWRLSPKFSRAELAEAEEWNAVGYLYGLGGPPPYGTDRLMAFSTDGRVALAVTTTYRVDIYDSLLRPVTVIERDERGPQLTAAERRNAGVLMADRRREEKYYPYGDGDIPDRKPPLRDLWFDRDGRLWVERYLANEPREQGADVYGADGNHLFSTEWPRGVDFGLGAIRGDTGLGIQTDALGIQRVARVRFGGEEADA
ncbi:hypothetical protein [Candidatus Palauibacter sp.]|uniref:hypothetical protein n=1 Tax=Candidatus Palauibacter sp. TaxID=3101350 RepID=UPI003AF23962